MCRYLLHLWLSQLIFLLLFATASSAPVDASSSEIAWHRAKATADDATSIPRELKTFPGTDIPDFVVRYLVEERHGIDLYPAMAIVPGHHGTLQNKVAEALYHPRGLTPVSPFTYEGETYFLFPAFDSHESRYPRWNKLLRELPGIRHEDVQPFFLAKLTPRGPHGDYELMAVRTTALADDKLALMDSFQTVKRKLMTLHQLLRNGV